MTTRKNHIDRKKARRQGALERLQKSLKSTDDEKKKKRISKEIETLLERIQTMKIKIYGQIPIKFYIGVFLLFIAVSAAICDPLPFGDDPGNDFDAPFGMQNV